MFIILTLFSLNVVNEFTKSRIEKGAVFLAVYISQVFSYLDEIGCQYFAILNLKEGKDYPLPPPTVYMCYRI